MKLPKNNLLIVYLVGAGKGISGGTRIHVECTKKWIKHKRFKSLTVWTSNDGYRTCANYGVDKNYLKMMDTSWSQKIDFWFDYLCRVIKGIWLSFSFQLKKDERYIIYASSDFWADFFPALIIHFRYQQTTKLVTPIYLFAPKLLTGYDEKFIISFKLIMYNLTQQVMMWFARRYSDCIFVTYESDLKRLHVRGFEKQPQKVIVGGIEFEPTSKYFSLRKKQKKFLYDGIFVGRFHPQKGIIQLMNIWKIVVQHKPDAQLAMLGDGENNIDQYIKNFLLTNNMDKNVFMLGFKDGAEKYELFANTKVYLNTNLYDAGGMATMEAMACGLPVVTFDFLASRSMIGDGALRAIYLDEQGFATNVLKLLDSPLQSYQLGKKGREYMKRYDWEVTADRVAGYMESLF